jgi:hemerythrin-like metal-binding protein
MLVQWNESDNLGIPTIDRQHRELYKMLNELSQAMAQGQGKEVAAHVMGRLYQFIRGHFEEEDKALRQLNSPRYRRCRDRHAEELTRVQYFLKDRSATDPSAVIDLLYFLDSLLDGHIDSDRQALGLYDDERIQ